jgi:hypothetical protein
MWPAAPKLEFLEAVRPRIMGILDDAIREHLDLKRKHGARDADIQEIEDEAFGSTDRPDPFAANELFNEVASTGTAEAEPEDAPSEAPSGLSESDIGGEEPTSLLESEALRPPDAAPDQAEPEPPAEPISPPEGLSQPEPISPPEGLGPVPGQVELPDEIPGQECLEDPLEGYQPPEREAESYPPVEEEAPADTPEPPSTSESLEDLIAEEEPFPEDTAAPPAAPPEDISEPPAPTAPPEPEEAEPPAPEPEPESSVPDPPPPPPSSGPEPPGRARGRVDVPTQEHPSPGQTGGLPPVPAPEAELDPEPLEPRDEPLPAEEPLPEEEGADESGGSALYDFETDEDPVASPGSEPAADDFEALGPAEEEAPYLEEEEPYAEEPASGTEPPPDEPGTAVRPALEDEEAYEGGKLDPEETYEEEEGEEGLWFEKGPPQDFDFEDD